VLDLAKHLVVFEVADCVGDDSLNCRKLALAGGDLELVFGDGDEAVFGLDELTVEVGTGGDLDGVDGTEGLDRTGRLDLVVVVPCRKRKR
jgi:hypothetical protein